MSTRCSGKDTIMTYQGNDFRGSGQERSCAPAPKGNSAIDRYIAVQPDDPDATETVSPGTDLCKVHRMERATKRSDA